MIGGADLQQAQARSDRLGYTTTTQLLLSNRVIRLSASLTSARSQSRAIKSDWKKAGGLSSREWALAYRSNSSGLSPAWQRAEAIEVLKVQRLIQTECRDLILQKSKSCHLRVECTTFSNAFDILFKRRFFLMVSTHTTDTTHVCEKTYFL